MCTTTGRVLCVVTHQKLCDAFVGRSKDHDFSGSQKRNAGEWVCPVHDKPPRGFLAQLHSKVLGVGDMNIQPLPDRDDNLAVAD
jgi:hypothetical protein